MPPGAWPPIAEADLLLLLRHWATARGEQAIVPRRSAIDPTQVRRCLPNMWIFRWNEGAGDYVCALAGQNVIEAWGNPMIGASLAAIHGGADAGVLRRRYDSVLAVPALQISKRPIAASSGLTKNARRLVLPLHTDGGAPYGVIGMTLYRYDPIRDQEKQVGIDPEVQVYPCAGLPREAP